MTPEDWGLLLDSLEQWCQDTAAWIAALDAGGTPGATPVLPALPAATPPSHHLPRVKALLEWSEVLAAQLHNLHSEAIDAKATELHRASPAPNLDLHV